MKLCVKLKEELEWLKARVAAIDYSRVYKEESAHGVIWYSSGYLPSMPAPFSLNYMKDLDKVTYNVLKQCPKYMQ